MFFGNERQMRIIFKSAEEIRKMREVNLGAVGWHPSCQENFFKAAGEVGWTYPFLPQSISWFTEIPIAPDHTEVIDLRAPMSAPMQVPLTGPPFPGDHALRAPLRAENLHELHDHGLRRRSA